MIYAKIIIGEGRRDDGEKSFSVYFYGDRDIVSKLIKEYVASEQKGYHFIAERGFKPISENFFYWNPIS